MLEVKDRSSPLNSPKKYFHSHPTDTLVQTLENKQY